MREDLARLALAGFGQVKVNQGGLERGVPEILADQADGDSGVEKVGGEAMAQGVAGDRAMPGPPIPAQGKDGGAHRGLHRGIAHGLGGASQGVGQGGTGALPAAPRRGEEPLGIAVALPEGAQPLDEFRGNGHLAIFAALAADDADDAARGVDVAGLEMDGLAQAQAAVIHQGEDGAETSFPDRAEKAGDLLAAQDVGELLVASYLDPAPAPPLPAEVVAVEGAQGADGLVDGGVLESALLAQGDEEIEDLVLAECGGIAVREGLVELAHPAEVGGPGSWREATEIEVALKVAPPLGRGKIRGGLSGLAAAFGWAGGLGGWCCFFS